MTLPTRGEAFAKLIEHLRYAQEAAATLGHLDKEQGDELTGDKWLIVSEQLKRMQHLTTQMAIARAQ